MNLSAGIHVKIRIKQEIYQNKLGKVKEKKKSRMAASVLAFFIKKCNYGPKKE